MVDVVVTLAVLAFVVAISVPVIGEMHQKRKLIGAAEEVSAQLKYAQSEAFKRQETIYVGFHANGSSAWQFGIGETTSCSSSGVDRTNCTLSGIPRVFKSTDFSGIVMKGKNGTAPAFGSVTFTSFDPVRGTALAGTVVLQSAKRELRVVLSSLGRVTICSPSGSMNFPRYSTCSS